MICVSLGNISFEALKPKLPQIKMVELRLDLLSFTDEQYQYIIRNVNQVIATFRKVNITDTDRIEALGKMMQWGVQYIDIEVDADSNYIDTILRLSKQYQCKTIFSYHHFTETPCKEDLEKLIQEAQNYHPELVKIVTTPQTQQDVARVLSLYEKHSNLLAFCMGERGKISRLASLFLGAPFAYASFSKTDITALGQMGYLTLKELQKTINP